MDNKYNSIIRRIDIPSQFECSSGYVDNEDCSWYHHNWLLLRKLGMVSNPYWHEEFYKEKIKEYVDSSLKSLVLGTADFSMPLLCSEAGIERLEICDKCKTPLNICTVVSQEYDLRWTTYQQDIFNGLNNKYDIVINDAFLTRFDYNKKRKVLEIISESLNDNGVYITTIRNGWNNGFAVIPTQSEKDYFISNALLKAKQTNENVRVVLSAATNYINNMISYPINNENYLKELVNGLFSIEYCAIHSVPGECLPTKYFQVVMKKK